MSTWTRFRGADHQTKAWIWLAITLVGAFIAYNLGNYLSDWMGATEAAPLRHWEYVTVSVITTPFMAVPGYFGMRSGWKAARGGNPLAFVPGAICTFAFVVPVLALVLHALGME